MSILLGSFTLVLSILLPSAILYFTGFELLHFSLFFIIPVGAIAIGYICGYGYFKGLYLSNKYISKTQIIVGIIISFLCMLGIEFACYQFICVDPVTNELVYSFKGDSISNYYMEGFGQLTFFNYIRFKIESTPISFSYKARAIGDVTNPVVCWIFYIVDFLGITLGVVIAALYQRGHEYCHTCNLYNKKIKLFSLSNSEGSECINRLNEFMSDNNDGETLGSILISYRKDNELHKQDHYDCVMIYCDSCRTANINFKKYLLNSKKQIEEVTSFVYSLNIDYDSAKSFL
ncbi:MAG: hypothetical protein WBI07_12235 [Mobilitalea sp.]